MRDRWTAGIDPIDGAGNIYANLIETFVAVLPGASADATAIAREACRLLARSVVCADKIVDHDVVGLEQAENVLAAQVCQLEGLRLLQALVPPDHAFWRSLVERLREFADACLEEAATRGQFVADVATAERIAFGKNALARIMAPLACALGRDVDLVEPFDRAVVDLIVAVQALDDAIDWRDDLAACRVSLITARIWSELGSAATIDEARRHVHARALREVLGQGRKALDDAMSIAELRRSDSWLRLTRRIAIGYDRVLVMLA
jgi:hypothetical protein